MKNVTPIQTHALLNAPHHIVEIDNKTTPITEAVVTHILLTTN